MRIFLTGGTGYVGSSILSELSRAGHSVGVLSRNPAVHDAMATVEGVHFVQGDLEDEVWLPDLTGYDALIHNALIWDDQPKEWELKDPCASVRIFRAAANAGVGKIIYTSSTAVNRPFLAFMTDQTAIRTSDSYGATKAASELFLFAIAAEAKVRANVIRLGPVVGPPAFRQTPFKSDRRLAAFAQAAVAGEAIRIEKGSGRQFISNTDAGRLFRGVLESEFTNEVFIGVDAEPQRWESLARATVAKSNSQSEVVVESTAEPICPMFDTSKLERSFGFKFDSRIAMNQHLEILLREETNVSG